MKCDGVHPRGFSRWISTDIDLSFWIRMGNNQGRTEAVGHFWDILNAVLGH